MTQKWIKAAARYEAAKEPGFKPRRKRKPPEKPSQTLAGFMANGSWEAAIRLLAVTDREICLGYSETVMSRTAAVIIDGGGLKSHSGIVGMAAAYTKEKPEQELIDGAEAISMLEHFPFEGNLLKCHPYADERLESSDEDVLVTRIKEQLDEIAAEAP